MRPLRIEMEGFSTFRERTVLDFTDLDLVALTGSTGAGKSTVIDAMTFALYGSVSRYGNTAAVEPVIHQLATEARVRFDFEIGGRRHMATRVTRRQNRAGEQGRTRRATTKEARLERVNIDPSTPGPGTGGETEVGTEVLAGSVKELDAAVVSLLGLTFNQFTRTVVLPQGEFANFLRDEPLKRQELLKRLLDLEIYSRMGSEARKRADAADQQVKTLEHELTRLDVPDEAAIGALQDRQAVLASLRAKVDGWLVELAELDQALEPLRGRAAKMQSDIDALDAVSMPDGLQRQGHALVEAERAASEAVEAAARGREQIEKLRTETAGRGDRAELLEIRQRLAAAATARTRLETLAVEHESAMVASREASEARAEAERQRDDTNRELNAARRTIDASHLVGGLVVGDECPVCRQTVDELPAESDHEDGSDAYSRLEAALAHATESVEESAARQAAARAHLAAIETQQAEWADAATVDSSAEATVDLAGIERALRSLDEAADKEQILVESVAEADRAVDTARREVDRIRAEQSTRRQQFGRQRDPVAHLEPPEVGFESLHVDWSALADWATAHRADLVARRQDLVAEGRRLRTERDGVAETLSAAASDAAVSVDAATPGRAVELISVAEADARAEHRRALDIKAGADRLADDIAERVAVRDLNRELGRHLSAKGFESWLLAEAFDDITARATTRLLELSAGRFSLAALERDITIIDHHNADEQRPAKTLSGGETFLASLALALALADSIADLAPVDAPRAESIFLDEGFGTLDPDTLDVVAGAIEELAASGRMIGIVTHVRDLAERMPARFEIKKLPGGSSAELVTL